MAGLKGIKEDPPRSGRYVIRFADASRRYHREWCGSLEEAVQRYELRRQQVEDGVFDPSTLGRWSPEKARRKKKASTTSRLVNEVIDEVVAEADATLRSARSYRYYSNEWKRELAGRTLDEVTVEDVLRWRRRKIAEGISPATCNRHTGFLRRVYNHAIACGYTLRNPAASNKRTGMRELPEHNEQDRVLTVEEQAALQRVMRLRDFLIVCLAIETGMRRANIFGCRREWIDLDRRKLRIPGTVFKTGRPVTIYLNEAAIDILRALLEMAGDSEWLLPAGRSDCEHVQATHWVETQWTEALKAAGIPHMRFHDLRGTMATRMFEAGATLEEVRIQGGWSNYDMVQRYARVVESHRREAAERAGAASRALLRSIGSDYGTDNVLEFRNAKRQ